MKILNAKAEEYKGQARMFENGTGSIVIEVRPRTKSGTRTKLEFESRANNKTDDRVQIKLVAEKEPPETKQDRAETKEGSRAKIKCKPRVEIEEKTHAEVKIEDETEDPKKVRDATMVSVEEAPQKEDFKKRKYSSLVTTLDESACNQCGKESTMKTKLKSHVQPTHGKYENNCDHHAAEALWRAGFKKQKRSFHEEYEAYCEERIKRSMVRSTLE